MTHAEAQRLIRIKRIIHGRQFRKALQAASRKLEEVKRENLHPRSKV